MTRYVLKSLLIVLLCGCATAFSAARDTRAVVATRGDSALDIRLQKLESELRCLVCQNQTLADSNAGLAVDLRREVRDLAEQGRTDVDTSNTSSPAMAISCSTSRRSNKQHGCCGSDHSCC